MAKGKNLILDGFSGKLGDSLVIRQRGDITVLSESPGKRDSEPTEAQRQQQLRFQQAIIYGKAVIADEARKAEYETKGDDNKSAYNVAVADFLRAPSIDEIDLSGYTGNSGEIIRIRATDDFKVAEVKVEIWNADGSLVEEGMAVQSENALDWNYTTTASNTDTAGDKIVVKVSDQPGNIAEQEETL